MDLWNQHGDQKRESWDETDPGGGGPHDDCDFLKALRKWIPQTIGCDNTNARPGPYVLAIRQAEKMTDGWAVALGGEVMRDR